MAPAMLEEETGPDALAPVTAPEKKKNFADDVRKAIPECTTMARNGQLLEAIESLLLLEKRARLGGDAASVVEVALVILRLCFEGRDFKQLNSNITLLCKRRSQFKQVQVKVIQEASTFVDQISTKEDIVDLINTLRAVSEGKIFVESDRAKLTFKLAKIREADGDIAKAAELLQEEQVESYGAMSKREKIEYLLEEIRLCLAKKDYVTSFIISKKVNRKFLDEADLEDLKIRFYTLLIEYYTHEKDTLELARANLAIYRCPSILADEAKWAHELRNSCVYLCLAPFDNHQVDLVQNTLVDENLDKIPAFKALLNHFVKDEIAQWPLPQHQELTQNALLSESNKLNYASLLKDRVIQHDIRVVAKYYTRIRADRLAELLRLSVDAVEKYVADMVTSSTSERLLAKIDRPAGVIRFERRKDADNYLTEWADDISELLVLVDKTCHLIHKETMLHNSRKTASS